MVYEVTVDGSQHRLELERGEGGVWKCRLDGREIMVDAVLARPDVLSLLIERRFPDVNRERPGFVHRTDLDGRQQDGDDDYDGERKSDRHYLLSSFVGQRRSSD